MNLLNRLLSVLLGLVLLALGLAAIAWIIALEIGAQRLPGELPRLHAQVLSAVATAGAASLSGGIGLVTCIVLVVVGVLLLFSEIKPSPPRRLEIGERAQLRWRVDRRSFEQALSRLLENRTVARRISVRLRRGWRLAVSAEAERQTREELETELRTLLERLGSDHLARVRLKIRRSRTAA